MSLRSLLNEPVTVQHVDASGVDVYGNATNTSLSTTATVGYLEQTVSTENQVDRDTVVTDWQAFLPAGTQIDPNDRLVFNTGTFEVVGLPAVFYNPRTRRDAYVLCHLRLTSG